MPEKGKKRCKIDASISDDDSSTTSEDYQQMMKEYCYYQEPSCPEKEKQTPRYEYVKKKLIQKGLVLELSDLSEDSEEEKPVKTPQELKDEKKAEQDRYIQASCAARRRFRQRLEAQREAKKQKFKATYEPSSSDWSGTSDYNSDDDSYTDWDSDLDRGTAEWKRKKSIGKTKRIRMEKKKLLLLERKRSKSLYLEQCELHDMAKEDVNMKVPEVKEGVVTVVEPRQVEEGVDSSDDSVDLGSVDSYYSPMQSEHGGNLAETAIAVSYSRDMTLAWNEEAQAYVNVASSDESNYSVSSEEFWVDERYAKK